MAGFDVKTELFLKGLISATRNKLLLDVQMKARILVRKGITLIGIMDEINILEDGTIFF